MTSAPIRSFVSLAAFCVCFTSNAEAQNRKPYVLGHRGVLRQAPENTIPCFRACLDLRFGFEFDVRRTRDGHLVCVHDTRMNRTTNIKGAVSTLTFNEIRAADAGEWFDSSFSGQQVPTIEEIYQLIAGYKEHDILCSVDIKVADVEEELMRMAEKYGILHRLLFIGTAKTDIEVRKRIVGFNPKAECTVFAKTPDEFSTALADPYGMWVHFRYLPSREEIAAVRQAGKRTYIGLPVTIPYAPDIWQELTDNGIDAILTDYPIELCAQLRKSAKSLDASE